VVVVEAGEYAESIILGSKPLEVRAAAGPQETILQGAGVDGPTVRVRGSSQTTLRGMTISGGRGPGGSGVFVESNSRVEFYELVITGNDGPDGRGLTLGQNVTFRMDRVVIAGNVCRAGSGGGVYVGGRSSGVISNTLVVENSSSADAGGIAIFQEPVGEVTLTQVTVAGNQAGGNGGGLRLAASGNLAVRNSILWGNVAQGSGADLAGGLAVSLRSSNIGDNPFPGDPGILSVDPEFEDPAGGDYRLQEGSPVVDVGDPAAALGLYLDLEGLPRLADGNGDGSYVPDLGAYESQTAGTLFLRGDANADRTVNLTDPVFLLNFLFLGDEGPTCLDSADADDDGIVNISDAIFVLGFLFMGGGAPPDPGPDICGIDLTEDQVLGGNLGCEDFAPCE
jgi:hypothetical protein